MSLTTIGAIIAQNIVNTIIFFKLTQKFNPLRVCEYNLMPLTEQ